MVQYEVIACPTSVKGLLNKPRAPIIFLPFTITFLQQGAQLRWLICTCAASMCRKTHAFVVVCHRCLQPWRILDLPWQRIDPKNTEDDCQHKEVHIASCVKRKWTLLLSSVLLLKLHRASACTNKTSNLLWLLIELFFPSSFVSSNPPETNKILQTSPSYWQIRSGLLYLFLGVCGLSPKHFQNP